MTTQSTSKPTESLDESTITILHREVSDDPVGKGIWDSTVTLVTKQVTVGTAQIQAGLEHFCEAFGNATAGIEQRMSNYNLTTIELTVDLTAKGEVRLISSSGAEVRGGVKLVFTRKA